MVHVVTSAMAMPSRRIHVVCDSDDNDNSCTLSTIFPGGQPSVPTASGYNEAHSQAPTAIIPRPADAGDSGSFSPCARRHTEKEHKENIVVATVCEASMISFEGRSSDLVPDVGLVDRFDGIGASREGSLVLALSSGGGDALDEPTLSRHMIHEGGLGNLHQNDFGDKFAGIASPSSSDLTLPLLAPALFPCSGLSDTVSLPVPLIFSTASSYIPPTPIQTIPSHGSVFFPLPQKGLPPSTQHPQAERPTPTVAAAAFVSQPTMSTSTTTTRFAEECGPSQHVGATILPLLPPYDGPGHGEEITLWRGEYYTTRRSIPLLERLLRRYPMILRRLAAHNRRSQSFTLDLLASLVYTCQHRSARELSLGDLLSLEGAVRDLLSFGITIPVLGDRIAHARILDDREHMRRLVDFVQAESDSVRQRFELLQDTLGTYKPLLTSCEQAAEVVGDFDMDIPFADGFL